LKKIGIVRGGGGEFCHGDPRAFTILGLDIEAEKLVALYSETEGHLGDMHRRAVAIIKGVCDRTRTVEPPPAEFIRSLGEGVEDAIIVANLGPDKKGKDWVVVVAGRQRTWGLRLWNEKVPAVERLEIPAEIRAFRNRAGIDAELTALSTNATSNVFVAMRPSQLADHAIMLREKKLTPGNIAIKIGAKDADHVALLCALGDCAPGVQRAVDAMRLPLSACAHLVKLPIGEQERRVARQLAGKSPSAKNKAAPVRAKTRSHKELAQVEGDARRASKNAGSETTAAQLLGFAAGLAFSQGKEPPPWARPLLKAAAKEAAAEEAGG
jgi:hypothetical protein